MRRIEYYYDEAYTFVASLAINFDELQQTEIYSVMTFNCDFNNLKSINQVFNAFRVSRFRPVGDHIIGSHFLNFTTTSDWCCSHRVSYDFHDYLRRILQSYVDDPREEDAKGTWAKFVSDQILDNLPGILDC